MVRASARARRDRLQRFTAPIQEFIHTEVSGGIVLLGAAILALLWANSPWNEAYERILEHRMGLDLGFWGFEKSVHALVNDGAMAAFFFLVGLEIKREVVVGELSDRSLVAVPIAGALGGMLLPVVIFLLIAGGDARDGWGIAMATDIAFALGVLALLGPRVPVGLKALLLAVAIVDDIGAILVIAVFYAGDLDPNGFIVAGGALAGAVVLQRLGVWDIPVYVALGLIGWAGTLASGIHPTIIGVAFGLLTPWRAITAVEDFTARARETLDKIRQSSSDPRSVEEHAEEVESLLLLSELGRDAVAPLDRLEHELHVAVAFAVVPAFAFVNAGVHVDADTLSEALTSSLTWAVFAGLVVGKPIGILLGIWLAVRVGARLPRGVGWSEIAGLGMLAGIGFTVSLLITDLAFAVEDLETYSKLGIILASAVSGTAGYLFLRRRLGSLDAAGGGA